MGRLVKVGDLTEEKLISAFERPAVVKVEKHAWTFTNHHRGKENGIDYIYARLNKFKPEGTVNVVDPKKFAEISQQISDLSIASSPFVYIPSHSGVAYLHVWNLIEQPTFVRRFESILLETYQDFFVDCSLEAVSDLRSFAAKLAKLDGIYELTARINPPNPLFGHLWKSLKDYLEKRQTDEMRIVEKSETKTPLKTDLKDLIESILDDRQALPMKEQVSPDIGDAAVLMAADGYGSGKVVGKQEDADVVIRTSETVKSFLFDKEPKPDEIFKKALEEFEKIKNERHMEH